MKEYSLDIPASPETDIERLSKKAVDTIRNAKNEVATEIYDEGYGIAGSEGITNDELAAEEADCYQMYRADLSELVLGLSFEAEALSVYDSFAAGDKTAEEAMSEIKKLFLDSEEQKNITSEFAVSTKEELDAAGSALSEFIESKITGSEDRAARSKWGLAKLDYENGNSEPLQSILKELSIKTEDGEEADMVQKFINFLKHQKFGS